MPRGYPPSVFVSSTCYDLGQVRLNLKAFIESMGYQGVISESSAFPVDPNATTFDNCIKAVRERADLFVLIVGGRYGTQLPQGKSITNLEYLEAKALGLPIFVFVANAVLHALPLWKTNPTANFSATVDSPKLYEFVEQLRGEAGHWIHGFDSADDIITALRNQWAILFTESLEARAKLRGSRLPPELMSAAPTVLAIALEEPSLWEFKLLSAALKSGLGGLAPLRNDLKYQLAIGPIERVHEPAALMQIVQQKISEIRKIADSFCQLLNVAAPEALGPAGVAGNAELIVYVARRLVHIAEQAITWSISLNAIDAEEEFAPLIAILAQFSSDIIAKVSDYPHRIDRQLLQTEQALARGEKYEMDLSLKLDAPGVGDEFATEMARLEQLYGLDDPD